MSARLSESCHHGSKLYVILYLIYGKFLSYAELVELIASLTFDEKLEIAHKVVEEALRVTRTLFKRSVVSVGFSGGKGSLAVLDIVLQHVSRDDLYVVYCNTLNEYLGNREYVLRVVKEYFHIKKLVEVVPKFSPWRIWEVFGFPKVGRTRYYTPACCILLKELPMKVVIERYGINLDFTGIQAAEAFHRLRSIADNGLVRRTRYIGRDVTLKRAIIRATPIGLWLDNDVWGYIKSRGLPVNPVYERYGIDRQGCFACTNTSVWREMIKKYDERLYRFIESKLSEWGVQEKRLRFYELISVLEREFNIDATDASTMYVIREHFG